MTSFRWGEPLLAVAAALFVLAGGVLALAAWRAARVRRDWQAARRRRRCTSAALRLGLVAALVLMMAAPEVVRTEPAARAMVFVFDAPAAAWVPEEQLETFLRGRVASRHGEDCEYGVLFFGDAVVTATPFPTPGTPPSPVPWGQREGLQGRTGGAAALAAARLLLQGRGGGTVYLATDGAADPVTLADEARRLREAGLDLEVVYLSAPAGAGVAVRSLLFPPLVHQLAQVRVRAVVDNPGPPVLARLRFWLGERKVWESPGDFVLAAGTSVLDGLAVADQAGQFVVRAELETLDPRSGRRLGQSACQDALTVLDVLKLVVVEGEPGAARMLTQSLLGAISHLPVPIVSRDLAGRVAADKDLFANADVVALVNVPEEHLRGDVVAGLGRFVRAGGGLVVYGGGRAFDCGGYHNSEFERELLPVLSADKHPGNERAVGVFLVLIDVSGSMEGPKLKLAKQVGKSTVGKLPDGMAVSVLVFDAGVHYMAPPVVLTAVSRAKILAQIDALAAQGGTDIGPAMTEARTALDQCRQKLALRKVAAHLLVVSDGIAPGEESLKRQAAEFLKQLDCQVHTVHVFANDGPGGASLLKAIAQAGGGRTESYDGTKGPPQFELSRKEIQEEKARLGFRRDARDIVFPADLPRPIFEGRYFWDYNRAGLRPEAHASLRVDLDPSLAPGDLPPGYAWHRLGDDAGGQVMACLIDVEGIWSRGLLEDAHARLLLSEPVFFCYHQKAEGLLLGSLRPVAEAPGDLLLTVRGALPDGAALEARERPPAKAGRPAVRVPLLPVAPGEYQGRFQALPGEPSYRFEVVNESAEKASPVHGQVLAVVPRPRLPESAGRGPAALEPLARAADRPVLALDSAPEPVPLRFATTRARPWNAYLGVALVLLLVLGTLTRFGDGHVAPRWYWLTALLLGLTTLLGVLDVVLRWR